jgi:DNA-binding LytR/AlgR family response regulator
VSNIFVLAIILYFIVFLKAFLLLIKQSFATQKKAKSLQAEKNKFLKGYLAVRANRQQAKILYKDINYIESMDDYVKIHTFSSEPVITRERISHIIKELPENFIRIHRSFIVNTEKVEFFSKTEVEIDGSTLPISRTYKKEVNRKLSKKSLD